MQTTLARPKRRTFGGKIKNFSSKKERAREKKHLEAYLKGNTIYTFRDKGLGGMGENSERRYSVIEIWK